MRNNNKKYVNLQQLCICGAQISRSDIVLTNAKTCEECRAKEAALVPVVEAIITTPRNIVRCIPCKGCKSPYAPCKLDAELLICRNCLTLTQTDNLPKRNRILAGIIANYTAALNRRISLGVM